jgi:ABC-type polysaccharide/polyol phosphate transport system ATPase subunit
MISISGVSKKFISHPGRNSATLFETLSRGWRTFRSHKTICALEGVDLCVDKGQVLGIVGPNGSGKSTLLRIIAGIYKPTSGHLQVRGAVTSIFQSRVTLFWDLSVEENIFLFGAIMGMNRREVSKHYDRIISFSGLGEFAEDEVRVLSEGMMERLSLAMGIEMCRDILLLDELILAGDGKFREGCIEAMRRIRGQQKTIVLASHDLKLVEQLCDNAVLLNNGKILASGGTGEVIKSYLKLLEP